MTTAHGRAVFLCINFYCTARWRPSVKFIALTLEEIETIISQTTPTNTKEATACNVSVHKGTVFNFILVQFDDFNTVIEMHAF